MANMKALISAEGKTASVKSIPIPTPAEGEILVKVHYVAQNPADWKVMAQVPPGRIIGCDFAGTVSHPNGSSWRENQRVAGFVQGTAVNPTRGAFAEYVVVESSLVYAIPDKLSYQDAAVVPLAFATAIQALFQRLKLPEPSKPAKSAFPVLVNGGTSSVGKYAVQLAKHAGLFVVATGSKRNHELLASYGADVVVDYNDTDWIEQIRKATHDGLEHAFDCISELETTKAIAGALSSKKGGHIVTILPRKSVELDPAHSQVRVESTIVYTVFQRTIQYGAFDNCGSETPEDKAFWEKYLSLLPEYYLTSGTIKPNRVKEFGGIEDILKGFELQKEGKVSAEKLVYKIAS
ncbi:zinc-binding dehydrogenase [Pseudomassariella vexata]|uniref:Zinc-binding dehydrogenase n=1 Tax=Pseudomassariella vexata TaxID=1141098 RepID=A0A1Y2E8L8_9PEZI|nr:zinc-binding dehydrogenase [Pseudomassariella vexata]XP_040718401.1 zinc-binding dehydrogenase [Pseudomassariella vexata]ORY67764.1 zinc-binding dehydrogenase [Pseudomassariella vexata]ORY67777.1 zinc-binding dehydrogenase [Pseudomassariella vexata]